MTFRIQSPIVPSSVVLHDSLRNAALSSQSGAGMFAFASKEGIELLFSCSEFTRLLNLNGYYLVVGIDEITGPRAIETLIRLRAQYPKLTVKAFYHSVSKSLFHPKFSFFRSSINANLGSIVVGSGNLTAKGLRGNWEAYYVHDLNNAEFDQVVQTWDLWIAQHANLLLEIDDPRVMEKAVQNAAKSKWQFRRMVRESQRRPHADIVIPGPVITAAVEEMLLLEVPVGRKRNTPSAYTQANLGKLVFEQFFGIDVTAAPQDFFFQHVNDDGSTGNLEKKQPIIKVVSSNYNFRLDATEGKGTPEPVTPPLCIFTRIGLRTYRYKFLLPSDETYTELRDYLYGQQTIGSGGRKIIKPISELYAVIPKASYLSTIVGAEV